MVAINVSSVDRYVWFDIETTGLDPRSHTILEIAAIVTDLNFNQIDSYESLVAPDEHDLLTMSAFVREMHTKNHLLEALQFASCAIDEVGQEFKTVLERNKHPLGKMYLVGNSISSLDIPFTKHFWPYLYMDKDGPLHYRSLDITSLRLALRFHKNTDFVFEKDGTHRAMGDVRQSIQEFKYLLNNF